MPRPHLTRRSRNRERSTPIVTTFRPRLPKPIVRLVKLRDSLLQDIVRLKRRPNPYHPNRKQIQHQRTMQRHAAQAELHRIEQELCAYLSTVVHTPRHS